jgi:hypothetical protein
MVPTPSALPEYDAKPAPGSYLHRRPGRQAAIIGAVIVFHLIVIGAVLAWPGSGVRSIFAGEIKVTIVPDSKLPPKASARPGGE